MISQCNNCRFFHGAEVRQCLVNNSYINLWSYFQAHTSLNLPEERIEECLNFEEGENSPSLTLALTLSYEQWLLILRANQFPRELFEQIDSGIESADAETIVMHPVDSSWVAAVGYDATHSALFLDCLNSPDIRYRYTNVPAEVFQNLLEANSIGGYFNEHIKYRYEHETICLT